MSMITIKFKGVRNFDNSAEERLLQYLDNEGFSFDFLSEVEE